MVKGKSSFRASGLRYQIAQEAARIIAEGFGADFQSARHKAAARLGCNDRRQLPDNQEIEAALQAYQQLFHGDDQSQALAALRQTACDAMDLLKSFSPRLVGAVKSGTADQYAPVRIHLFAETPEHLLLNLIDRKIPWEERVETVLYTSGRAEPRPCFHFFAGEHEVELLLLPLSDRPHPPLDPVTNRPDRGVSLDNLKVLMAVDSDPG